MATRIFFRERKSFIEDTKQTSKVILRELEHPDTVQHEDVVELLAAEGYHPIDNRVMLVYR